MFINLLSNNKKTKVIMQCHHHLNTQFPRTSLCNRDVWTLIYENHDIAIAMSSSRADPLLGLNILSWLVVFKYINQCCTALAGGI